MGILGGSLLPQEQRKLCHQEWLGRQVEHTSEMLERQAAEVVDRRTNNEHLPVLTHASCALRERGRLLVTESLWILTQEAWVLCFVYSHSEDGTFYSGTKMPSLFKIY